MYPGPRPVQQWNADGEQVPGNAELVTGPDFALCRNHNQLYLAEGLDADAERAAVSLALTWWRGTN